MLQIWGTSWSHSQAAICGWSRQRQGAECDCIPTRRALVDELEMGGAPTRGVICTYGGGGGEDSRRFCLGFGLPRGRDEFLCARNCIVDERRGSCCESDPARVGSRSGLGLPPWRGAGDALRERRSLGEALMLVASGLQATILSECVSARGLPPGTSREEQQCGPLRVPEAFALWSRGSPLGVRR